MLDNAVTVSYLNGYIKNRLEGDEKLKGLKVRGEISNFKLHSSGHLYFTLKDDNSKIKCVMFRSHAATVRFKPEDGLSIVASGYISLYERDGQYQLYCTKLEPDGIGSLYLAFEKLKKKLETEGIFSEMYKKPMPAMPERIGVITSPTGAVIRDIINVSGNRNKGIDILLYPVKVQGEGAADEIAEAIGYMNSRDDIDIIIIGRGGGSIEELWAFNEEKVARAVYESRIPIISAVGHETDFTIADFAADMRASTPSHAAELAVPDARKLRLEIGGCLSEVLKEINNTVSYYRSILGKYQLIIGQNSPEARIYQRYQLIDSMTNSIVYSINSKIAEEKSRMEICRNKLNDLNPYSVMQRGFALVEKDNRVLKGIEDIDINTNVKIIMHNGKAECNVLNIMED